MLTYFLTFVPFFFCSLSTRRILLLLAPYCLMSPRWRYVFLFRLLHVFLLPCVIMCPVSFSPFLYINIYMYASPLIMHSFLFYFAFFRLSPSLSPSITPWLKRFLLPWAHPWRVSSIGPIWWRDHGFYCSYCCTEGSVKTPIPSAEPGPVEEGAQTKKVNESASIPAETPTPRRELLF